MYHSENSQLNYNSHFLKAKCSSTLNLNVNLNISPALCLLSFNFCRRNLSWKILCIKKNSTEILKQINFHALERSNIKSLLSHVNFIYKKLHLFSIFTALFTGKTFVSFIIRTGFTILRVLSNTSTQARAF